MKRVGLVIPHAKGAGLRFVRAALRLPDTRIAVVTQDNREDFPPDVQGGLAGHWRIENALDVDQLAEGARGVTGQLGGLDRFFAVTEHLQLPVAQARATMDLPGMDPETVADFRDKSRMKARLRAAGVPCARFKLATDADTARAFVRENGFPVVVKPPSGAGAADTWKVTEQRRMEEILAKSPPHPHNPMLLEEFIRGEEYSLDSVWLDGKPLWCNIGHYRPTCLEVKENDWIQWTVLLPRAIDGPEFHAVRRAGEAALRALGFASGMSHMEWFRRPDGSIAISEVGARPPGAQFCTLIGLAHDADLYQGWMRVMIHGAFDPPVRKYAAGGAYLRAMGRGRVAGVKGTDEVWRRYGPLIREAELPAPGTEADEGYEGQGFILLRHESTGVVAEALKDIVRTIRVELL